MSKVVGKSWVSMDCDLSFAAPMYKHDTGKKTWISNIWISKN